MSEPSIVVRESDCSSFAFAPTPAPCEVCGADTNGVGDATFSCRGAVVCRLCVPCFVRAVKWAATETLPTAGGRVFSGTAPGR